MPKKPSTNSKEIGEGATRNEKGQLLPGTVLNPKGRPKGSLDFKTKWYKVIDKIAEKNGITAEEVEEELLKVGYKKAKEGDYSFYRDVMDRLHGKPVQPTDMNIRGDVSILFDSAFNKEEDDEAH